MADVKEPLPADYESLLDWLDDRQVPDRVFAKAYAGIGPRHRAWIKSTQAAAFAEAERALPPVCVTTRLPGSLHLTLTRKAPAFAWLFAETGSLSGVRLAAAVGALAACNVGEIGLVFIGAASRIPASVLAAAELGGVERVCCLGPKHALAAANILAECGEKGFVGLFQARGSTLWPGFSARARGHAVWRAEAPGTLGILAMDPERQVELAPLAEELTALHPECSIRFYDPKARLDDLDSEVGGPACLATQGLDALVVDGQPCGCELDPGLAPLILTPGTIGLWRHPTLHPSLVFGPFAAMYASCPSS